MSGKKATGRLVIRVGVAVEIEGEEKPTLIAEWLVLRIWEGSASPQRTMA
jgi:hypothetical protein